MIRVRQIKISIEKEEMSGLREKIARKLGIHSSQIEEIKIHKKSLDARDKKNILWVYDVDVKTSLEEMILNHKIDGVLPTPEEEYVLPKVGNQKVGPIAIIGSGPSGLFSAYLLAEAGFHPVVFERGEKMEERIQTVEKFFQSNQLNPNSNVQFGEGGAGTFSDGKLNTLVKDKANRCSKVFDVFIQNGAPEEIRYLQKPHIGTDILRDVIVRMRKKILEMGGEFHYQSTVTDFIMENGALKGLEINHQDVFSCEVAVLAIGHSARDTFLKLYERGLSMKPKNFAVGVRIEHLQDMISQSQYGDSYKVLPPASYKVTHQTKKGRGVYSFCMCPGGFVVNASSEEGCLAVNGMSNYHRDEKNANSAIVVTVGPKDFGNDLFAGMKFQRELERKAYELGEGFIPVQLYEDFVANRVSTCFKEVVPNTKGKVVFANLNELFPDFITNSLKEAIPAFGRKIRGFDRGDAILLGVESRTSSPIMMERGEDGVSNLRGIYPCGEGAGHAGGITTAAMDGLLVAEKIIEKYKPNID